MGGARACLLAFPSSDGGGGPGSSSSLLLSLLLLSALASCFWVQIAGAEAKFARLHGRQLFAAAVSVCLFVFTRSVSRSFVHLASRAGERRRGDLQVGNFVFARVDEFAPNRIDDSIGFNLRQCDKLPQGRASQQADASVGVVSVWPRNWFPFLGSESVSRRCVRGVRPMRQSH